jgi:uncharacterized protein (DUF2236 family)
VNRESVLLLGGARALLMQVAHPLVAAAVADHSRFRNDPLRRLTRTLEMMYAITFGSADEARASWQPIDRVHSRVEGALTEHAGEHPAGTRYRARDPELLLWVHGTLIDTSVRVYERYVGRFAQCEKERYYEESKASARLFAIPERMLPRDWTAFERYVDDTAAGLRVTTDARALAEGILHPPLAYVPRAVFDLLNLVSVGLLPEPIRRGFALSWSPGRQRLLDGSSAAIRALMPVLPAVLRFSPVARAAERRE